MLNDPGEQIAAEPEVTAQAPSALSVILQVVLILLAAIYLFAMVWLYVRLPWIALAVAIVAIVIAAAGVFARLRKDPNGRR